MHAFRVACMVRTIMAIKLVDSPRYHLWTDALHARALARQTQDAWNRGTYVRWTVMSAWTAFEATCADILSAKGLGNRFKDGLDEAIKARNLAPIDWGQGLWQRVLTVYQWRKGYVHVPSTVNQARLVPALSEAEDAVVILRDAIKDIVSLAGAAPPQWVVDDSDAGWEPRDRSRGFSRVIHGDADASDPDVVRIAFVYRDAEHESAIAPPGTDHKPLLDELIRLMNVPIEAVRAYRGSTLLEDRPLLARGSDKTP